MTSIASISLGLSRKEWLSALPFTMEGRATVQAAASSLAVQGASTVLQTQYFAIIVAYGVTVRAPDSYDYSGSLTFQFAINGSPYLDNNAGTWTLQRGDVANPLPCFIRTPLGASLQFNVFRTIAGAQKAVVDFTAVGFMIPLGHAPKLDAGLMRV